MSRIPLSRRTPASVPSGVWALGFVSLLMDTSSEAIHALLPVFLTSALGVPISAVGWLEGVSEGLASVTKAFSGAWSDRLGRRKPLVVAGYGLAALTKPLFALATGFGLVFLARSLDRFGKGLRGAPRDALVADLTPPGLRGASFGLRQSLDTVGAIAGPLLAFAIMALAHDDFRLVFWVASLPALLAVVVLLLGVSEPEASAGPSRSAPAEASRAPRAFPSWRLGARAWWVIAIAGVFTLARFSEAFLLLRAGDLGVPLAAVPLVLVAMNACYAASAYPAGRLSDRFGRRGLLAAGMLSLAASQLVLALAGGWSALAIGAVLWGFHMGLTQGLFSALVADAVPPPVRGTAFGIHQLVNGAALLAASVLAGWLWARFGPPATFLAGAGITLAALASLGLLRLAGLLPPTRHAAPGSAARQD